METKFTPGPWSVGPPHVVAQRTTDKQNRRTTRFIAEAVLAAPYREGEREANAHLIASAPETYEASELLESLCSWLLHRFGPNSPEGEEAQFRLTKARAALAKARGEPA